MTRAFATIQGISSASRPTTPLERTPTPPPHRTNRAKEARGPGGWGEAGGPEAAEVRRISAAFITVSFRQVGAVNLWDPPAPTLSPPAHKHDDAHSRTEGRAGPTMGAGGYRSNLPPSAST
ncbi:hypothetical protein GCM10010094_24950 [Streptomyces flaveus]|uniref:Uncharacterized protein n=1 Tax=Streptomyces flaveus TaxID=66370 RepID=A0A917QQA3_9ACTN|nr:hypothetical protein GCM10010094_24950 [Streptomyces flaveus]